MFEIQGPGSYSAEVVGESHYQRSLELLAGGRQRESAELRVWAVLVCERDNPHDNLAVRVDIAGRTVGHLSRDSARAYRQWLTGFGREAQSARCRAEIRGGWDRGLGDRGHYGVVLDLPSLGPTRKRANKPAPQAREPFDFRQPTSRASRGRRVATKKGPGCLPILLAIGAIPLAFCCVLGLFTGPDSRQPSAMPGGGVRYDPAVASGVRIDAVRLVRWRNPKGEEVLMVCLDWTNTGSHRVRVLRADVRVADRDGRRHYTTAEDFCVYWSGSGVGPGQSYSEKPEDAFALGLVRLVGDEISDVKVTVSRASETAD